MFRRRNLQPSHRIKPDIVAPGDGLMSAHSAGTGSQTCTEMFMTGNLNSKDVDGKDR
jgi:hypothetical protein